MRSATVLSLSLGATATTMLVQPRWLVRALATRFPDVLFCVKTTEPLLAVTIDDGPDGDITQSVLDALGQTMVKATFFLLASEVRRPSNRGVVQRMVDEGHEIGNHLLHDDRSVRLSPAEFERQLMLSHDILAEFAEPRLFRPGSGWFRGWMLDVLREHGYRCVLGSIYPYDAHHSLAAYSRLFIELRAHPGGVIVLHDRGGRGARTANVLANSLPRLRHRGYEFRTLSGLQAAAGAFDRGG